MKKIFALAALASVLLVVTTTQAQVRNVKNTKYVANTDAAGADTIQITPSEYVTVIKHTLTDSVHYKIKSTGQAVFGDEIVFVINNTSGGTKFKTIPATAGFQITGADSVITVTASKSAIMTFIYNGTAFVEKSKIVQ